VTIGARGSPFTKVLPGARVEQRRLVSAKYCPM